MMKIAESVPESDDQVRDLIFGGDDSESAQVSTWGLYCIHRERGGMSVQQAYEKILVTRIALLRRASGR